jgi:hypothetical protein
VRKTNRAGLTTALTATIATAAMALAGCTSSQPEAPAEMPSTAPTSAAPSPSATQEAGPKYSPEEEAAIEAAKAAVLRFQEVADTSFANPERADPAVFDSVAIDPIRSDYNAVLGSFAREGRHQNGKSAITFAEVRSVTAESSPEEFVYPKVMFDICLDSSETELVDANGEVLTGKGTRNEGVVGAYEEPGEGWFVEHWDIKQGGEKCAA